MMVFYSLNFPRVPFNAIYALSYLLHVPTCDLPVVLRKLQGLLKPGGLFFLGVYGGAEEEGVREKDWHDPPRFFAHHTDEYMQQVTTQFFELVSFKVVPPGAHRWHFQRLIL